MVAAAFGTDAIRPEWEGFLNREPKSNKVLAALAELGIMAPAVANELLGEALVRSAVRPSARRGSREALGFFYLPWLTSLPEGLRVPGDLYVWGGGIGSLPAGLRCDGEVSLNGCGSLVALAPGIRVKSLHIGDSPHLAVLPGDLVVESDLSLADCSAMEGLPEGIVVPGNLSLNRLGGFRSLPDGLAVGGYCQIQNCPRLERLPRDLKVAAVLHLFRCNSLVALPPGLVVGDLSLNACDRLRSLPDGLVVADNLSVTLCPAWDGRIPDDAQVAGKVITNTHRRGIPLARWRALHPGGEGHGL
jgi:hypothetical protein